MPAKSQKKAAAPEPMSLPAPQYPALETFIQDASADQVDQAFSSIRAGLKTLKGPKVDQAKKVSVALDHVQGLLSHLLSVRERLDADRKGTGKGRK